MATYQGERFVVSQLESILAQLGEKDEVIIVDDASTDRTCELIRSLQDPRIQLIESTENRGVQLTFEHALRHALGDVIILADQDDEWVKGRVAEAVDGLQKASLVVCDAVIVDECGVVVEPSFFRLKGGRSGAVRNLVRNSYLGCCMAFRREVLEAALPFPRDVPMHDWWIGLVADAFFSTAFLDAPLVRYRRHNCNASTTGGKSQLSYATRIRHRWIIALSLISRMRIRRTKGIG
jgi:glycosyltransferase involved in cell wall biosynthesis